MMVRSLALRAGACQAMGLWVDAGLLEHGLMGVFVGRGLVERAVDGLSPLEILDILMYGLRRTAGRKPRGA